MNDDAVINGFTIMLVVMAVKYFDCGKVGKIMNAPFPSLTSDVLGSLVLHLASQLSSPPQKQVMRLVSAAIVLGFSWLRCVASHSSRTLCLKAAKASASGQSTTWFFLVRNMF